MSIRFQCSDKIIISILKEMKQLGLIHSKAQFNSDAEDQLRKEVAYRDFDFLLRLGRKAEEQIVSEIIQLLRQKQIFSGEFFPNEAEFGKLREIVHSRFQVPWTSISRVMERLLFVLSAIKQPRTVFAAGIFCGNTLVWNIGPGIVEPGNYSYKSIYGVDIDKESIELAKQNFSLFKGLKGLKLICENALNTAQRLEEGIDYVYLDADDKHSGKKLNLEILKELYPRLNKGAWILAHDTCDPGFSKDFREYFRYVRDKQNFSESISFDIDPYGLELTIK